MTLFAASVAAAFAPRDLYPSLADRSANATPVDVELVQGGLDRGWWSRDFRVTSEDVAGEQINADRRKYLVTVPANGKREVRVTYETRY